MGFRSVCLLVIGVDDLALLTLISSASAIGSVVTGLISFLRVRAAKLKATAQNAAGRALVSIFSVGRILESVTNLQDRQIMPNEGELLAIKREAELSAAQFDVSDQTTLALSLKDNALDAIAADMDRIKSELTSVFGDAALSSSEKEAALNKAQRDYCQHLSLILHFNGGKLPADLQQEWDRNRCGRYVVETN